MRRDQAICDIIRQDRDELRRIAMGKWVKRMIVQAVVAAVVGAVVRAVFKRKDDKGFDPAKPKSAWGATSLTIDD